MIAASSIRKRTVSRTTRGDTAKPILIQAKGDNPAEPAMEDGKRLNAVRKRQQAQQSLLASWK
jgi:hypothetical protein